MLGQHSSSSSSIFRSLLRVLHLTFKRFKERSFWYSVLSGQFLSLLVCLTAIFSDQIMSMGIQIPAAQSMFVFALLLMIFGPIYLFYDNRRLSPELFVCSYMWKYMSISFIEVQANNLAITAYKYTSPVSVQILDCIAIPTCLVLSRFFLKYRYRLIHYVSVAVAIIGATVIFVTDKKQGSSTLDPVFGNGLAVAAGMLYGLSNVAQEFMISERPISEYLFSIGLFGTIMSLIQSIPYEISDFQLISEFTGAPKFAGYLTGFILVLVLFYVSLPTFMSRNVLSAVGLNISLQTSDIYTFLAYVVIFGNRFNAIYQVAWVVIIISSIMFHLRPYKCVPPSADVLLDE